MASSLVSLPEIERLSSRVVRILGGNPGKTVTRISKSNRTQGTNTYLVGQGPTRLLIDTGEGKPSWLASLQKVLSSEKASIDRVILTHWHHDHVGGIPDLLTLYPHLKIYKHKPSEKQIDVKHGEIFKIDDTTLRAFYCPGHTNDHMAQEREGQIVDVLGREVEGGKKGWQSMDLVRVIYKGYPENLHAPAERGVLQVLEKLKKEGRVGLHEDEAAWFLQSKPAL
ncbi:Metallo-hydrolase/oxidoreductase [Aureobasidium pullulans]|nr:Metallo-hydrolase/oxidoreductase [Aureobasidium pullulans]